PDGVLDLRAFVWSKGLEPRRYARVLADLGRWFEDLDGRPALLAPEINSGWGAEVVSELTSVEVNYWNLYRWTRATSVSGRASGDYGWQTNRRTRPALLAAMSRWMAPVGEDPVEFRVRNFWR